MRKIEEDTFSACTGLERVALHNVVGAIGPRAFQGCAALKSIHLPLLCKTIAEVAFDSSIEIVASKISRARKYVTYLRFRPVIAHDVVSQSLMVPLGPGSTHEAFYRQDALAETVERFEVRHPGYEEKMTVTPAESSSAIPSRFSLSGDVYTRLSDHPGPVRIMLAGDLMARLKQQMAALDGVAYSFDSSFDYVRELISTSDLAVGNLETMVSVSAPIAREQEYVDA